MSEEVGEKAGENSGNAVEVKIEDLVLVVGNMNRFPRSVGEFQGVFHR